MLSVEEYLNKVRQYLSNMLNDLKTQGEWKIQLSIAINLLSSKVAEKTSTMYLKSDNKEIMIGLEESIKGSEFVFDAADLLHYKCHKITLNHSELDIDSPK